MRLKKEEIKIIKNIIRLYDKKAKIYIFGSRIDDRKKGGDIDIFVLSDKINFKIKQKIKIKFFLLFGDRKIDLIITNNINKSAFYRFITNNGVEI
ncbi:MULTISPECIES: nucleotidyltransferase domain-containing protein [unclassified Lebetimonas]|uniref:nucleotidyltransferase domain-containing protein n=1 Tax=unclassified Lebetimonas TaxID=2648158 RepID=UPI0004671BD4|nr:MULTISPECIES: nucleotidyltransferase domain-containing protein [unclassified Lebetimonas]